MQIFTQQENPRQVDLLLNGGEFDTFNTIAGLGALVEIEAGRISFDNETYQSIQATAIDSSRNRELRCSPNTQKVTLAFNTDELSLLATLTTRGACRRFQAEGAKLTHLSEEGDTGFAVVKGIKVAQSIGWLTTEDSRKNFKLYNAYPHLDGILSGVIPASLEEVQKMHEVADAAAIN